MKEIDRMVKLDLVHKFKVKDQSLQVNEEKRWQWVKFMIFLNAFDLHVAELTKVVANNLRLSVFTDAFLDRFEIFYLNGKNIKGFYSFLLMKALITVDNIDNLAFKIIAYQKFFICIF